MKVGKIKTKMVNGDLVFFIAKEPVEKSIEELRLSPSFRNRERQLKAYIELINRSAIVNKDRLSMRFTG